MKDFIDLQGRTSQFRKYDLIVYLTINRGFARYVLVESCGQRHSPIYNDLYIMKKIILTLWVLLLIIALPTFASSYQVYAQKEIPGSADEYADRFWNEPLIDGSVVLATVSAIGLVVLSRRIHKKRK